MFIVHQFVSESFKVKSGGIIICERDGLGDGVFKELRWAIFCVFSSMSLVFRAQRSITSAAKDDFSSRIHSMVQ